MKKILILSIMCLLLLSLQAQIVSTVKGEVLVQLHANASPMDIERDVEKTLGITPQFSLKQMVSGDMCIWLFSFNEDAISKKEILHTLQSNEHVKVAQANHIVAERIVPNDPFFNLQWHHNQIDDHDIDSELAWDITTGGTTVTGDEIVVCVVEIGGAKWDVADLINNHWVNENEISGNGIDDDGNGYIDDYDGWNINNNNDIISAANHGTQVSSMIGSTGDNEEGVAGVNWNVKLMQVQIGSVTESNIIAGYNYPLKMRKLYNETNGAQGAFVVVTNSSWGTDFGQPADAPLWCAMYDSLGVHGVLSCGSTANNDVDVDAVGDLPTACPSDFLISVTATNSSDLRPAGFGYGLNSIDIGAPGVSVYMANATNYGTASGTSFAGPCVAGGVALLYAAPCNSLMEIANIDPAAAALSVKNYILDGVDVTSQLTSETVSGGRFNIHNSLVDLMDACDNTSCIAPFGVIVTQIPSTLNYEVQWNFVPSNITFDLRYGIAGSGDWNYLNSISSGEIILDSLQACSTYAIELKSYCTDQASEWSSSTLFTTDGCCINPDAFEVLQSNANTALITWNTVLAAQSYEIIATPTVGSPINFSNISSPPFELTGLSPCEQYAIAVYAVCLGNPPTNPFYLHTTGCTDCADLTVCEVIAGSNSEYIQQVSVADINRTSSDDGGYIFVNDITTELQVNQTYTITCTPGYAGQSYAENFRAWIDYNSDGDLDDLDELIFDAPSSTVEAISGNFTIPSNISSGQVRLRVAMRYAGGSNPLEPNACGSWTYGEIEDYCVTLNDMVSVNEITNNIPVFYPNPASDMLFFNSGGVLKNNSSILYLFDSNGKIVLLDKNWNGNAISLSGLSAGLYNVIFNNGLSTYSQRIILQ